MPSQRLGDILMARGILTAEVWERAQRLAAERGGLAALWLTRAGADPAGIIGALVHAGVPVAREEALLEAPRALVDRLPAEVGVRLGALPVALEDDRLVLAMADPFDQEAAVTLAGASGMRVRGRAADHRHLARAIELHYGRRPPGWETAPDGSEGERAEPGRELAELFRPREEVVDLTRRKPSGAAAAPTQPATAPRPPAARPPSAPPASGLAGPGVSGPGSLRAESEILGRRPATPPESPVPDTASASAPDLARVREALARARKAIAGAADRDAILQAAVEGLLSVFPRVAVFVLQGGTWHGRAAGGGFVAEHVGTLVFPRDLPSLLWKVADAERPWLGGLPDDVEEDLLFAELRPLPRQVAVLPVRVGGRIAVLLYGDAPGGAPLQALAEPLGGLSDAVGEAFQRLILRRKLG